ncbi:hypothetical protein B0J13DRAFT_556150 [Dactylonectria estremocensis]|uniref:NACHT domain-containing protein n=1 Tax=Dactylonectria estremocensis TaxID=1079267 RepID=A0A9P9J5C6_9HYPO|nr:hypothetical protein B0J13DRAFT_556150 [Dactylonectria estremocensis]
MVSDPLSTAASIFALMQLAGKVVSYLRDVKGASAECKSIMVEASHIRGLLASLEETVQASNSASWASAMEALNDDKGPLAQVGEILETLRIQLEKTASGGRITRLTKALQWPFQKSQADSLLRSLQRQKMLSTLALQNDHLALSLEIQDEVHDISTAVKNLRSDLQVRRLRQDDLEAQEVLRWISPLNFKSRHLDIFALREGNTGTWILESEKFQTWINGTPKTLFCQGIPGAGKTIIASVIVDHLQTAFPEDEVGIACVYCNRQENQRVRQQSTTNLLGSLIRQFEESRPSDLSTLKELQVRFRDRRRDNLISDFVSILKAKIEEYHRAFLVVDGLDECPADTRDEFIEILQQLGPKVNIALMSRDITAQEAEFDNMIQMEIRATSEDLTDYVDARIQSSKYLRKHIGGDAQLWKTLHASISATAKGMFLMSKLHLDLLDKQAKRAKWALVQAMHKLPESLDATYDEAFERINGQCPEDVDVGHRVLAWVCLSPQPLHVKQLQYALLIQPGDEQVDEELLDSPEYLLTKCAGLVEVDCSSRLVRFVQGTVLHYLSRNPQKLNRNKEYLTQTCLAYLLASNFLADTAGVPNLNDTDSIQSVRFPDLERGSQDGPQGMTKTDLEIFGFRDKFPFTTYLVDQLHFLLVGDPCEESDRLLMALFSDDDRLWRYYDVRRWLSLYLGLGEPVLGIPRTPLLLAVELDLPQIVLRIVKDILKEETQNEPPLERSERPRLTTTSLRTVSALALNFAALRGRPNTLRSLLAKGADINALTPVFALTSRGIKTYSLTNSAGDIILYSPLCHAIYGGHLAIVEMLLGLGANLDLDATSQTQHPLQLAIERKDASILKFLLANGASANTTFRQGDTILHSAVKWSNIACVDILLESGALVDAMNDNNESPLYIAVIENNQDAVSSLVRFGARPKMLLTCPKDQGGQMAKLETLLTQESDENLRFFFQQFSATSIVLDATCVLGLFRELLSVVLSRPDDRQEPYVDIGNVDHQLARFNRWSGNIGVFAGGYGSLDYRLRENERIQNRVRLLLKELQECLQEALGAGTSSILHNDGSVANSPSEKFDADRSSPLSESSDSSWPSLSDDFPDDDFHIAGRNIQKCIDSLYSASAVLHSATHGISWDKTNYRIKDEEGNDIDDAFASYAFQLAKFRFPEAQDAILQRIADAITRRRRNFLFRQKFQERLRAVSVFESKESRNTVRSPQSTEAAGLKDDIRVKEALSKLKPPDTDSDSGEEEQLILEQTSAIKLGAAWQLDDAHQFESALDVSSVATTGTTGSGYHEHVIALPPIPDIPVGSKEVECPYCFMILFEKELTGHRWKQHVLKDLRPYLCLAPHCSDQGQLFHDRKEWTRHMVDHATIWKCPVGCGTFDNMDDFKIHVAAAHSAVISQTEALAQLSKIPDPVGLFDSCPLCGFKQSNSSSQAFYKHLGGHLEVISLVSLPWAAKDKDDDDDLNSRRLDSIRSSLKQSLVSWMSGSDGQSIVSQRQRDAEWGFAYWSQAATDRKSQGLVRSISNMTW